jgi:hypothetical protein
LENRSAPLMPTIASIRFSSVAEGSALIKESSIAFLLEDERLA